MGNCVGSEFVVAPTGFESDQAKSSSSGTPDHSAGAHERKPEQSGDPVTTSARTERSVALPSTAAPKGTGEHGGDPERGRVLQGGLQGISEDLSRLAALWPNLPQGVRSSILTLAASVAPNIVPEAEG